MSSFVSSQSMAENEAAVSSLSPSTSAVTSSSSPRRPHPSRPTLALPPRTAVDTLFSSGFGASPGPMTLVSNFFSDADQDSDSRSFMQLLAGAMASPAAASASASAAQKPPLFPPPVPSAKDSTKEERPSGGGGDVRFNQNRPLGLVVSQPPVFTVPPGLSPTSLLESPAFFSGGQSTFGMSHQQALAQVTAQAAHAPSLLAASTASLLPVPSFATDTGMHPKILRTNSATMMKESSDISQSDQHSQPMSFTADKPADDGYNWRKYGQKQVKGSEYPRSYYKCTHQGCPVKKKVEHSAEGQVTEIIYKGQHNHPQPQSNKRAKDAGNQDGNSKCEANTELVSRVQTGNQVAALELKMDHETCQATADHLSGSSGSEEVADAETRVEEKDEDEPDSKRRNMEGTVSVSSASHRTVTEPRIIVQTTSEVDLLDDGYRWRKYGQKIVKGNPYPRSYYKCTSQGCNVRKHVERAASDPKAVITTYEGKHNHDVPMARNSGRSTAIGNGVQLQQHGMVAENHALSYRTAIGDNDHQPVSHVQIKAEHTS